MGPYELAAMFCGVIAVGVVMLVVFIEIKENRNK
jgi:hypothetical protein